MYTYYIYVYYIYISQSVAGWPTFHQTSTVCKSYKWGKIYKVYPQIWMVEQEFPVDF